MAIICIQKQNKKHWPDYVVMKKYKTKNNKALYINYKMKRPYLLTFFCLSLGTQQKSSKA